MLRTAMAALLCIAPACHALAAGFRQIAIADPGNPPIEADLWYPASAPPMPVRIGLLHESVAENAPLAGSSLGLIVVSHGTGGDAWDHFDTAQALADAGFVVIAPAHTGDTFKDRSRFLSIWDRPRQLHRVIDYMLREWPDHTRLDPDRVGAFGFSAGGFTVLVAAGGVPDMSRIAPHCRDHPTEWTCQMIAQHTPKNAPPQNPLPPTIWVHDARIRTVVVAAPALGYTFGKSGLAGIKIPVQLWRAENDQILPQPFYAQAVADDLPVKPQYHVVPNAGHLDFLTPCSAELAKVAPDICSSAPGFDRVAFHRELDRDVVAFFRANLQ